jgi:hypothetical protein
MKRSVLIGCLACLAAGCGEAGEPAPQLTVRDSAGITVVQNSGTAWDEGEVWQLSDEPAVRIGQVEGENEYLLLGPLSSLRLPDGTIVVSNTGTEEIRWYDAGGRYLKSSGGRGGGPGEFSNLVWIYPLGDDTIVAWDDNPPRIAFFHSDGSFGRAARPGNPGGVLRGVFPDGSLLLAEHVDWSDRPSEGRIRQPSRAYRLRPEGAVADSLPVFPGREFEFRRSQRSISLSPPPFDRRTVFAVAGDGFFAGSQDEDEIGYYDLHGQLVTLLRWPGSSRVVSEADAEAYRNYWLDRADDENSRRRTEEWLQGRTYPELFPAYGDIVVDSEGNLWVEKWHPEWEEHQFWMVFDGEHRLLGTVQMPGRFVVHQIGSDFVLGNTWDELDVEYVLLYRLIKP